MACMQTQICLPGPVLRLNVRSNSRAKRILLRCKVSSRPDSARGAVEGGLKVLKDKDVKQALELFQLALDLEPDEEERRAAVYNSACCYAKLKRWEESAAAVKEAVNDYGLQLSVAEEDDDLADLRDQSEWREMMGDLKGSISKDMLVDLKSEVKSPFRFARIWIVGCLTAAAGLNLLVTLPKLILAFQGGNKAPDLAETTQLAGLNSVLLLVLVFLFLRDFQQKDKEKAIIEREQALSELKVQIGTNTIIPLSRLRGSVRPVIILGNQSYIQKSLRAAKKDFLELRERGISVIPVEATDVDPEAKIKALKKEMKKSSSGFASSEKPVEAEESKEDKKWRIEPYDTSEWLGWLREQKEFSGIDFDNGYIQIQLNGAVRFSGTGLPPWGAFVNDIPKLDSIRTQITENIGT